jgi:protein phosphatase inhibitor 2
MKCLLIFKILSIIIINLNRNQSTDKDIKWDEMNILQTLHPPDKDYGHMKIEEPKTPFNYYSDNPEEEHSVNESHAIDPNDLANKISESQLPQLLADSEDDDTDDENLTEDERKKKKEFEVKRKMHYNEFQAVKLARKLLEEEEEDDEDIRDVKCDDSAENGNQDIKLSSNPEEAIDQTFETSGNEHIDSQGIDNVQNR